MKIVKPKHVKNRLYHILGAVYSIFNYLRRSIIGYSNPRNIDIDQVEQALDYDFKVVERYLEHLKYYSKETDPLNGKVIVELGPGPDLGIGLILLALGAKKYIAFDVNELVKPTHLDFYEKLFNRLQEKYPDLNVAYLKDQLDKCFKGEDSRLNYMVDNDFKITKIRDEVDVVFSNAAFEHFEDVEKTIKEINNITKKSGIFASMIDLRTHARWITDIDPLNVYRYSDLFWKVFKYKGILNRVRTAQYKQLLESHDWFDIEIEPLTILEKEYVEKVKPSLDKKFRDLDTAEMQILGFSLMAKKK